MVGKILKSLRIANNLTQEKIAKQIDVARSTYTYYEQEGRSLSPDILVKLANFYNVSIDYMLGRTTNPDFSTTSTPAYSPDEVDLITKYRFLDESIQEAVRDLINTSYARAIKAQKNITERVS